MWIAKEHYVTLTNLIDNAQDRATEMLKRETFALTKLQQVEAENARLTAERTWFMHRLTQVEHERGMLMQDRLGVKIAVPEFVPTTDSDDVSNALSRVVDISTIGGDAKDTDADPSQNSGIDYTNLPGYAGKRR